MPGAKQTLVKRAMLPALCLVLAACGGSGSPKLASSPTTAPAGTSQAQSTPATTASTPTGTTATGVQNTPPLCRAGELSLSYLGGQGATGHGELGFALRNISSRSCQTGGYPGVLFLGRSAQSLPTEPDHTTHDYFGTVKESLLVVAPGQSVSFRLGVTHGMTSTAGCTTAFALQVIPPNDTSSLRTAIINGGEYECRTVTVSPVAPGTSAYP